MGLDNRRRRAAKARRRVAARAARPGVMPPPADPTLDDDVRAAAASMALRALVLDRARHPAAPVDGARAEQLSEAYWRIDDETQQRAVDDQLIAMARSAIASGWTPLDLYELARRRLDAAVVAHLLAVVASETARHPRSTVPAEWTAQLQQFGAAPASGGSGAWARRYRLPWPVAHNPLIDLLVLLASVPRVEQVLSPPGATTIAAASASHVDEGMLRKVRALLAKAESTEYADEAEALTAKAQQLMSAHSIERALAEADEPIRPVPAVRRIWLDAPYIDSKALLVDAVATSNHCRCILSKAWDFATLLGHQSDLDTVELLTASLLVQATRAMTAMGSQTTRTGTSRTRSYRRSFLAAFAIRIGERLSEAAADSEQVADERTGGSVLPVLASRERMVDDAMTALFPNLVASRMTVSNSAGWGAGRAAADLAQLNVRKPVDRGAAS